MWFQTEGANKAANSCLVEGRAELQSAKACMHDVTEIPHWICSVAAVHVAFVHQPAPAAFQQLDPPKPPILHHPRVVALLLSVQAATVGVASHQLLFKPVGLRLTSLPAALRACASLTASPTSS